MIPYHFSDVATGAKICPMCGHRTPRPTDEQIQKLLENGEYSNYEDAATKGHSGLAAKHWEANHLGQERPEGGWPHRG